MRLHRMFKGLLVFAALFCAFIIISGFSFFPPHTDFVRFLPGDARIDLMLEILVPLVLCVILSLLVPRWIAPRVFRFLKKHQKKTTFAHLPTAEAPRARSVLGRSTLPVLLTFSIANLLTIYVPPTVFYAIEIDQSLAAINLGLFIAPAVLFVALLIWTFEDQGIAAWKSSRARAVPVLEGVGRSISSFLRGYAGISAVITYIQLTVTYFIEAPSTLTWANYLEVLGPVLALVGYFVFWVLTTVVYEKLTVLNDPKLLNRFGVQEYQVAIDPKSLAGASSQ